MKRGIRKRRQSGHAVVEAALMMPWMIFLFVGVMDFGFYSYAAITTQNAARVAAMANSFSASAATNTLTTCAIVVAEMNSLPNTQNLVAGTYSCPTTASASSPIALPTVTTEKNNTIETDGSTAAVVTVSYMPLTMVPIPGIFNGPITITRTAKVPILNSAPGG